MARGVTAVVTVKINNTPANTVAKTVELVVHNNMLIPEDRDLNPGVNTRSM